MRIIISPAKKMNMDYDTLPASGTPVFLEDASRIWSWMRQRSYEELKELWNCNDRIAEQNFKRIQELDPALGLLTPAILAYEGIQYQYMAPTVFEDQMLAYLQEHLRILSGFYGVLRPMDGVVPYRLEMQAKARIHGAGDLYGYWGRRIYDEVTEGDSVVINLASKEYSRCVEKFLRAGDTFITCVFGQWAGEGEKKKVVQKGTYAKMARGEMVRFLAECQAGRPEVMKEFDRLGYRFCEERSTEKNYVFLQMPGEDQQPVVCITDG